MHRLTSAAFAAALAAATAFAGAAVAQEIYVPNLSYRTGPFAATGIPLMNGQKDYVAMVNARDGGANGIKLKFDECETGYNTEKGVECYEKTKASAVVTQPWSTGITLQVLPKASVDKVPVLAPGYGFSAMADGKTFKWAYNPPSSYWDAASMIVNHIMAGNADALKGKKVALLHLDHPFGKEPIPLLEKLAEKHGFSLMTIPVGLKEMQNQSAQWLQIRRERPDYVVMWGWGAMNAAAINEAVKTNYPMNQFYGVWWAGSDDDLIPAGEAAKGYKSISFTLPSMDAPVMADIKKHVLDAGLSEVGDKEKDVQKVFYQRGVVISAILVEAIKAAQTKYGTKEVTGEQVRWGLENLDMSEGKLQELGLAGMVVPFKTTCADHTGHGGGWMLEWDGAKFAKVSELLKPDTEVVSALEKAKAKEYADANAPWSMNDECAL